MTPDSNRFEQLPTPPKNYLRYIGEFALGGAVVIAAAVTDLPEVISIPAIIGGGLAMLHGGAKAFETAVDSEN